MKVRKAIEDNGAATMLKVVPDTFMQEIIAKIEQKVTKLKTSTGILNVHQGTGNFYDPLPGFK